MSKETNKGTSRSDRGTRRKSRSRSRRGRSNGIHPLVVAGGVTAVIIVVVVLGLWKPSVSAGTVTPIRDEEPDELLPLAKARLPLRGGHDMERIPRETPAPQPAPANVSLPQLDMPSMEYDFGSILKSPDVAYIFAVQNAGTTDLVIRNLVTSCGCTTAELTSSVIPPGQRADLTVTFDPDFHETKGDVVRLVWFATNDPTQPWVEVKIVANVQT